MITPGSGAATTASDAEVVRLRAEISSTDRDILELVIRRIDLARQIWERKLGRQLALVDPVREAELLDHLGAANNGRLSAAVLGDLHAALLAVTKQELERVLDPL